MQYSAFQGSNHPKSRKAIVTCSLLSNFLLRSKQFQSPQKPKGDCDLRNHLQSLSWSSGSNHPKSRKAIVTTISAPITVVWDWCSNHPKSRKAIVTIIKIQGLDIPVLPGSNHPKSRKAIVTIAIQFPVAPETVKFQSPQKPKGDCDYFSPISHSFRFFLLFQSPQKPKGDCDFIMAFACSKQA